MEPFTVAGLAALVVKIMSVVKAAGKDWNKVVTQVVAWVAGVLVAWVAASAEVTERLTPIDGGIMLGDMDFASVVLVGVGLASLASFAYDYKKARDGSDSAVEPALMQPGPPSG